MDIGWLYQNTTCCRENHRSAQGGNQPKITIVHAGDLRPQQAVRPGSDHHWRGATSGSRNCSLSKFNNTATLANQLYLNFSVDCLTATFSQKERNQIMQNFRDGRLAIAWLPIMTPAASMSPDSGCGRQLRCPRRQRTLHPPDRPQPRQEGVSYLFILCAREKKRVQGFSPDPATHRPVYPGSL